jgi:hypothetical protein
MIWIPPQWNNVGYAARTAWADAIDFTTANRLSETVTDTLALRYAQRTLHNHDISLMS